MKTGFIDLQINGYNGADFSSPNLTPEIFHRSAEAILESGTEIFLPTLVTSSEDVYKRNIALIRETAEKYGLLKHIPGIHLEGPFISPEAGAVGCHLPEYVRKPDCAWFEKLHDSSGGYIRMMTVAAELPGVTELIHFAREKNVVVSLGHQLATSAEIESAAAAGAQALTHLGNGCPNMLDRHRNPIWGGLACDSLTAMLITDGHHLPVEVVRCMIRIKGADRIIVTSDAAPVAGFPPGHYRVLGNDAVLEPDGRLHNPTKGCLVGSASGMRECMKYLAKLEILSENELRKVSFENAAKLLKLSF